MVTFSGFYSHSFAPEDKEICKKFEEIIKSFGFELYEHKRRESEPLSKEIIKHIEEKDVFISVITKNSFWLRDESTVAFHEKKPMIIFYEEGLNLDGILNDNSINKVPFRREDLLNSLIDNGILKTLYYFKETLIGEMYFPFYEDEEIYVVNKIINKNLYEVRQKRTIISLNDYFNEIVHISKKVSNINKSIKIDKKSFCFKILEKPNVNINHKILINKKYEFRILVNIVPNLKKGKKIIYQFKFQRKNLKRFFLEDKIKRKQIYKVPKNFECMNFIIDSPTKKLILKMEFPENYDIKKFKAYVFLINTSNRNYNEEKKVQVFLNDNVGYKSLKLVVNFPKINHIYHLCWEPPSKEEYLRSKR